ncbi:MAG: hypothetical protein ACPGXK_16725, partial [Phycisphaerae bacterium]
MDQASSQQIADRGLPGDISGSVSKGATMILNQYFACMSRQVVRVCDRSSQYVFPARLASFRNLLAGLVVFAIVFGHVGAVSGQSNDAIEAIRDRDSIPATDQDRILRWLTSKVDGLGSDDDWQASFGVINAEFSNAKNSSAFNQVLAQKLAEIAIQRFPDASVPQSTVFAISHQLSLLPRLETVPALVMGMKSNQSFVRFKSARSLGRLSAQIAADDA